jgi:hypothetical protein
MDNILALASVSQLLKTPAKCFFFVATIIIQISSVV